MPIYGFVCENCGCKIDIKLSVADRNKEQPCPTCLCNLVRQIGQLGFAFKGTGTYTTDVLHKKTHSKQARKEKKQREEGKSSWREY